MSDTVFMLLAYIEEISSPLFLTGFFSVKPGGIHNQKYVEIDVQRDDEDIAIPVENVGSGYRMTASGKYTTKRIDVPAYMEAESIDAIDLLAKLPGRNPYENQEFSAKAIERAVLAMRRLEARLRRALELQASQILTTGALDLKDANGNTVFAESFFPKATHFPTVANPWSSPATADPIADLEAICEVIRDDGTRDPVRVVMSGQAFEWAMANAKFAARFEPRRADLGTIAPMPNPGTRGGNYRGAVEVGTYRLDLWTYGGRYKDPVTGNKVGYVPDEKVIVMADGRLDATFGGIPTFGTDGRALSFLPGRITASDAVLDMQLNSWVTPDGRSLQIGVGSRPLLIPVAIDTFGALKVA